MPDVIELLTKDHRTVEKLFGQFSSRHRPDVAMKICDELTLHVMLEEELVYPQMRKIDRQLEQEAEQEHKEAKQLISQIRRGGEAKLDALMPKLQQAVQHHVQEEETEAFPKMRHDLGRSTLSGLGKQVAQRKKELLSEMKPSGSSASTSSAKRTGGNGGSGGRSGGGDMTKQELYDIAKEKGIPGRSSMSKDELAAAVQRSR